MIIEINDTKMIGEITEAFTGCYPFLKMEFYKEPHNWQQGSPGRQLLPHDKTIGEVRTKHIAGAMEIHSWHKTGEVEQEFDKLFGLHVQILRHHGDTWLQTVGTDQLSIEKQNQGAQNADMELFYTEDKKAEHDKTDEYE